MNALLDFVVCGPTVRFCHGLSDMIHEDGDLWSDFNVWDTMLGKDQGPPVPRVVQVSSDSSIGTINDDDGFEMGFASLSATEVAAAYAEYQDLVDLNGSDSDLQLHLLEMEDWDDTSFEEDENGLLKLKKKFDQEYKSKTDGLSLCCSSSFDSRYDKDCFDDGSSYSSYYFRLSKDYTCETTTPPRMISSSVSSGTSSSSSSLLERSPISNGDICNKNERNIKHNEQYYKSAQIQAKANLQSPPHKQPQSSMSRLQAYYCNLNRGEV